MYDLTFLFPDEFNRIFFDDSLLANRKDIFLQTLSFIGLIWVAKYANFILLVLPQSKTATKLYETIRLFDFLL